MVKVTLTPFWESERAERLNHLPTRILATVTKHNGVYDYVVRVVHCDRKDGFEPIWNNLYQQHLKVGKLYRTACELEYFKLYNKAVEAYNAAHYQDPACLI